MSDPSKGRLLFAARRLNDLRALKGGDLARVQPAERQQPLQEFFFHLVGAINLLAQHINAARELGLGPEDVTVDAVCKKLGDDDPVRKLLKALHPRTRGKKLPADAYSEEGSHFRILLLRNYVSHQRDSPFFFRQGSEPRSSLELDPRCGRLGGSKRAALCELQLFHELVSKKCTQILELL